jgi:hypothetical protein
MCWVFWFVVRPRYKKREEDYLISNVETAFENIEKWDDAEDEREKKLQEQKSRKEEAKLATMQAAEVAATSTDDIVAQEIAEDLEAANSPVKSKPQANTKLPPLKRNHRTPTSEKFLTVTQIAKMRIRQKVIAEHEEFLQRMYYTPSQEELNVEARKKARRAIRNGPMGFQMPIGDYSDIEKYREIEAKIRSLHPAAGAYYHQTSLAYRDGTRDPHKSTRGNYIDKLETESALSLRS